MDSDGRVPAGSVSDDLLEPDPHAPFGLRIDNDAAYRAFSDAWQQGGVVLVEGSRPPARRPLLRLPHRRPGAGAEAGRVAPRRRARRPDARRRRSRARRGVRGEPGVAPARVGARGHRHPRAGRRTRVPAVGHQPAQRLRVRDRHRADHPRPARHRRPEGDGGARDGGGARHRRRTSASPRSSTPTRTRCSATRRSVWPTTWPSRSPSSSPSSPRSWRGPGVGVTGAVRFFALAVLGFLFATYAAEPLHFGRSDNSAAYLGFLVVASLAVRRRVPAPRVGDGPYRPLAIALAVTVVLHVARPRRRRAPRAQHRVRLLGHRRHPRRGPGQHHVLAADRGGAPARRARGVASARVDARSTR